MSYTLWNLVSDMSELEKNLNYISLLSLVCIHAYNTNLKTWLWEIVTIMKKNTRGTCDTYGYLNIYRNLLCTKLVILYIYNYIMCFYN